MKFWRKFLRIGSFENLIFFVLAIMKFFFASFLWKHFDQAKHDDTFWPMPNILKGSVPAIFEKLHKNKNAILKPAFMEQLKYLTNSGSRNDSFA